MKKIIGFAKDNGCARIGAFLSQEAESFLLSFRSFFIFIDIIVLRGHESNLCPYRLFIPE